MAWFKLPVAAVKMVERSIIAGATNAEVRTQLRTAGYPELSDQSLSRYRHRPHVAKAVQERDAISCQEGVAQFGIRVRKLVQHAERLERFLVVSPDDEEFAPGRAEDIIPVSQEFRRTLKQIDDEVHRSHRQSLALLAYEVQSDPVYKGMATAENSVPPRIVVEYYDDNTLTGAGATGRE